MPTEAIKCSSCGASDVQEVKPSTYFCNYCDSVFKLVDPTQITVTQQLDFCDCGSPVEVRCGNCGKGVCHTHDAMPRDNWNQRWAYDGYLSVAADAYAVVSSKEPGGGGTMFDFEYELPRGQSFRPVISVKKVREVILERGEPGQGRHQCFACFKLRGEEVATAVLDDKICSAADCGREASASCDCCKLHFCQEPHRFEGRRCLFPRDSYKVAFRVGTDEVSAKASLGEFQLCQFCRRLVLGPYMSDSAEYLLPASDPRKRPPGHRHNGSRKERRLWREFDETEADALQTEAARMAASVTKKLATGPSRSRIDQPIGREVGFQDPIEGLVPVDGCVVNHRAYRVLPGTVPWKDSGTVPWAVL